MLLMCLYIMHSARKLLLLFKYCRKCYFCGGTLLNVNFIKNICFFCANN